ncbi:hypothetical protein, partial [Klebsiella pneumoniae]|uniref:hypothetical protein n=1 Tax=Klebsiella pneumoniae TaxID=573 RepID=UPI00379E738C
VGHLFMFLVGGKTPDQSVHLNLTTTVHSTFSLHPIGARTRSCNSDTLGLHQEQTYPRKGNLEELLLFDPRALD